jgi:DNA-binding NtrC family response regulator
MPIYELVEQNAFRQDLLYRINTVEIKLPLLNERLEDIPLLVEHFLSSYSKRYKKQLQKTSPGALHKLQAYTWPGNIRELQHVIERAVIMSDSLLLQPGDFLFPESKAEKGLVFDGYNLDDIEKTVIRKILTQYGGNISKAAQELGLTRTSLYRRMEKHGL